MEDRNSLGSDFYSITPQQTDTLNRPRNNSLQGSVWRGLDSVLEPYVMVTVISAHSSCIQFFLVYLLLHEMIASEPCCARWPVQGYFLTPLLLMVCWLLRLLSNDKYHILPPCSWWRVRNQEEVILSCATTRMSSVFRFKLRRLRCAYFICNIGFW